MVVVPCDYFFLYTEDLCALLQVFCRVADGSCVLWFSRDFLRRREANAEKRVPSVSSSV